MRKAKKGSERMEHYPGALDRRRFLSSVGKGLGLAALSSSAVASLLKDVRAASKRVAHLTGRCAKAEILDRRESARRVRTRV